MPASEKLAVELALHEFMLPTTIGSPRPNSSLGQRMDRSLKAGIVTAVGTAVEAPIDQLSLSGLQAFSRLIEKSCFNTNHLPILAQGGPSTTYVGDAAAQARS